MTEDASGARGRRLRRSDCSTSGHSAPPAGAWLSVSGPERRARRRSDTRTGQGLAIRPRGKRLDLPGPAGPPAGHPGRRGRGSLRQFATSRCSTSSGRPPGCSRGVHPERHACGRGATRRRVAPVDVRRRRQGHAPCPLRRYRQTRRRASRLIEEARAIALSLGLRGPAMLEAGGAYRCEGQRHRPCSALNCSMAHSSNSA